MKEKHENHHWIYCQNVMGFCLDASGGKFDEAWAEQEWMQVDLCPYFRHNLNTTQYHVRSILYATVHCYNNHDNNHDTKLIMGYMDIQTEGTYKPGGTMIVAMWAITAHISDSGSDCMGRWHYVKLAGKNNRVITVILAYRVCVKSIEQSRTDKYMSFIQQHSLLLQEGHENACPRHHFQKDLFATMRSFKPKGEKKWY